ncbi:unnamed protein product, partial [Durusdinium trenchii]
MRMWMWMWHHNCRMRMRRMWLRGQLCLHRSNVLCHAPYEEYQQQCSSEFVPVQLVLLLHRPERTEDQHRPEAGPQGLFPDLRERAHEGLSEAQLQHRRFHGLCAPDGQGLLHPLGGWKRHQSPHPSG